MKKLFLSLLIILLTSSLFALELQHDIYLGESAGLDTAFVFGSGKIRNSVGLYYDTHTTFKRHYDNYGNYSEEPETAQGLGIYYQFTWCPNFVQLGNIGMGMDVPVQIGIGSDSTVGMNCIIGLNPAYRFEFKKCDLLIGYKATVLLCEALNSFPFLKSSVTVSVRYSLKKGGAKSKSGKTLSKEASDNSDQTKVNIIPGTDIKTIVSE